MPELRVPQRDALNAMTPRDYADWLLDGFKDWPVPAYRNLAFRPIQYLLTPSGPSLWEQLANVHSQLSSTGRRAYELGLAKAVTNCPRRDEWAQTLWQLIHLGVKIRANIILAPISKILRENYLANPLSPEARDCFARVVNVLSYYQGESRLVPLWQELLKHRNLPPESAPPLFLSLCRYKAHHFPEYLALAKQHFDALLNKKTQRFPQGMVGRFAQTVSIDIVAAQLKNMNLVNGGYPSPLVADNWFLKALVWYKWSPFWLRNGEDSYEICAKSGSGPWQAVVEPRVNSQASNDLICVLQMMVPGCIRVAGTEIVNHAWRRSPGTSLTGTGSSTLSESTTDGLARLFANLNPSESRCQAPGGSLVR
ncbi:MAG: hypothetical protein HQL79_10845 [Magnetococcales bacterium]|nr:hypothetical protein [Magnetococcales bacterium]